MKLLFKVIRGYDLGLGIGYRSYNYIWIPRDDLKATSKGML